MAQPDEPEEHAREGDDRDIIAEYVAAHETTEAVEQGKDVNREDIDAAIGGYRALHDYLLAERGAPFEASDAIGPGPRLPSARFIAATQREPVHARSRRRSPAR